MDKTDRLVLAVLIGGVLLLLVWIFRGATNVPNDGSPLPGYGLGPGELAPAIRAEGWFNGGRPSDEDLQGKVVVVDSWAYWCGPCLKAAPALIATYERYRDQEVVFIGLTMDSEDHFPNMQKFIEMSGIPWANGFGAAETLAEFRSDYVPRIWVVGRDGKIVWNLGMEYHESLDSALDRALAAPVATEQPDLAGSEPVSQ